MIGEGRQKRQMPKDPDQELRLTSCAPNCIPSVPG